MAGVVGFARECAREFAPLGIGVHTIILDATGDLALTAIRLPEATPLAVAGLPEDIAEAVGALSSAMWRARVGGVYLANDSHHS